MEGVHTNIENGISMHTKPGCEISGSDQKATLQTTNCDVRLNGNSGCGSKLKQQDIPNNFGKNLNDVGGGVYVTEWTSSYVKHWFFPRSAIPQSISDGAPDISSFGQPTVNQQGPGCTIDSFFTNMSIIINTAFCGDWAGNVYSQYPECPQEPSKSSWDACVDFVGNNPSAFTEAYWQINSIRVYQMPVGAKPSSSYSTSLSSTMPLSSTNTIDAGMGRSSTSADSSSYTGPLSSPTASKTASHTGVATPSVCPRSNNTVYTDYNGQEYTIACGSDYTGGADGIPQGGVFGATSFENCMEICDEYSICTGVAFVGGNGAGTCYVKSEQGKFVFNGATNAARKGAFPSASVSMPPDMLATSSSDGDMETSMPNDNDSGTPTPSHSSTTSVPTPDEESPSPSSTASCPGVNEKVVTAPDGKIYRVYCSSDSSGSGAVDVKSWPTGDFDQCFDFCGATADCTAFTWAIGATGGGTCFVKRGAQDPKLGGSNLISAILVTGDDSSPSGSSRPPSGGSSTTSSGIGPTSPSSSAGNCTDGAAVTGSTGKKYTTYCGSDTTGGAESTRIFRSGDFSQCMRACDEMSSCTAWVWVPYSLTDDNGGACYLKVGAQSRAPARDGFVAGISQFAEVPPTSAPNGPTRSPVSPPDMSTPAVSASTWDEGMLSTTSKAPPRPTAAPCPYANGTEYVSPSGKVYEIICAMDESSDASTSSYVAGDYALCVEQCETTAGCVSITYSSFGGNQGFCYFRKSQGALSPSDPNDVHLNLIPGKSSFIAPTLTTTMTTSTSSSSIMVTSSMASSSSSTVIDPDQDPGSQISVPSVTMYTTINDDGLTSIGSVVTDIQSSSTTYVDGEVDAGSTLTMEYPQTTSSDEDESMESMTLSESSSASTSSTWSSDIDGMPPNTTTVTSSSTSSTSYANGASPPASVSGSGSYAMTTSTSPSSMRSSTSYAVGASSPSANSGSGSYAMTTSSPSSSSTRSTSYSMGASPPASNSRSGSYASNTPSSTNGGMSSSTVSPTVSPSASAINGNQPQCDSTFTDSWGITYYVKCKSDSTEDSFRAVPVYSGGFSACFGACDNVQDCKGFTFVGEDGGTCYLKKAPGTFVPKEKNNFVTAFQLGALGYSVTSRNPVVSMTSSSISRSGSSSGPAGPSSVGIASSKSSSLSWSSSISGTSSRSTSSSGSSNSSITSSRSVSMSGSSSSSSLSSSFSYVPPPPCPTSASYFCMENVQQTTCSASGTNYAVQCGIFYQGTEIDTSDINLMPGQGGDSEEDGMSKLVKRATVPDFATCQSLCGRTSGCKAFNFVGTNCTLLSSVSGYSYSPGALGGTTYSQGTPPPTPIDTAPACPGSAGKTFTDYAGVKYDLVCYTSYADNALIGTQAADNVANCLSTCDQNDLCAGVEFDTTTNLCRFHSSVTGTQTGNNNIIAALRVGGAPGGSPAYSGSVPPTTVTTTLLPTSTLCKCSIMILVAGN